MKEGEIKQIGTPQEIYEDPGSVFVAGFVGKVAFFPVELLEKAPAGPWRCKLGNKTLDIGRYAGDIEAGSKAVVMARPESLRLVEKGQGAVEGTVRMNVYLGHSIETYVDTPNGEVLIQVDDPTSKKIFPEGAPVSIDFNPQRIRLLKSEEQ
jgi:iron(III) transport system ATP-binding protein